MDPWRRRRRFFDDPFSDFDEEFRRMEERMARIFDELIKQEGTSRNFVYGFNMRLGSDGKPRVTEFGNIPRGQMTQSLGREPLVDILDGEEEIKVIAEIPGVEKEDIDLNADKKHLTIKVDTDKYKYYKELELPAEIKPDKIKATYKNGVLEVTMKRVEKRKKGKKIKVE